MDFGAQLGGRGKASTHAQTSVDAFSEVKRDTRALGYRPDSVVLRLQIQLPIFYKHPKRIVPM